MGHHDHDHGDDRDPAQTKQERPAKRASAPLDVERPAKRAPAPLDVEQDLVREAARLGLFNKDEEVVVGRFKIQRQLGSGAMGIVYQALDTQLDRVVALKLLQSEMASAAPYQGRARMLREAKAMARLSHPNVVAIHEVGTHEDQVYIAMEFVPGGTLRDWMAQRRSWPEVLQVLIPAGRGLQAAHAQGLIHRDFKPDNVLIEGRVTPKIVDFGLARDIDKATEESAETDLGSLGERLTATGTLLGTPVYMAPEQLRTERADARSDQFAFCVTLYEALYGERPFEGDDLNDLHTAQLSFSDAPSVGNVPAWVRQVMVRGLQFESADRYPSMAALLDDLDGQPQRQIPVLRRILALGALMVALLIVGASATVGIATLRSGSVANERRVANVTKASAPERTPAKAPSAQELVSAPTVAAAADPPAQETLRKARELNDEGLYEECIELAEKSPATVKLVAIRLTCSAALQDWDAYERACNDGIRTFPDLFDDEVCGSRRMQLFRLFQQEDWAECLRVAESLPPTISSLGYRLSCAAIANDYEAYSRACDATAKRHPTHPSSKSCQTTLRMRRGSKR